MQFEEYQKLLQELLVKAKEKMKTYPFVECDKFEPIRADGEWISVHIESECSTCLARKHWEALQTMINLPFWVIAETPRPEELGNSGTKS